MTGHLSQPISNFIDSSFVIQEGNLAVSEGVKKMAEHGVDSLVIINNNDINGMVTYKDILLTLSQKEKILPVPNLRKLCELHS